MHLRKGPGVFLRVPWSLWERHNTIKWVFVTQLRKKHRITQHKVTNSGPGHETFLGRRKSSQCPACPDLCAWDEEAKPPGDGRNETPFTGCPSKTTKIKGTSGVPE